MESILTRVVKRRRVVKEECDMQECDMAILNTLRSIHEKQYQYLINEEHVHSNCINQIVYNPYNEIYFLNSLFQKPTIRNVTNKTALFINGYNNLKRDFNQLINFEMFINNNRRAFESNTTTENFKDDYMIGILINQLYYVLVKVNSIYDAKIIQQNQLHRCNCLGLQNNIYIDDSEPHTFYIFKITLSFRPNTEHIFENNNSYLNYIIDQYKHNLYQEKIMDSINKIKIEDLY